jgi:flagellar assembly protein FliH
LNKVLKSTYVGGPRPSAPLVLDPNEVLGELGMAESDVRDVVIRAKQQVEIIVRTAQSEAKALLDQAYADGYQAGIGEAGRRSEELLGQLSQAIADEAAEREALVRAIEEQVLMLCVDGAEKIIRHEIRTDPGIVARAVKSCLRRVRDRNELTVRVSPQEVAHIRAMRDELLASAEGIRGVNVVDDRRVSAGGCVVESMSGDLDARIETQIDQIRRKLMDTFENESSKPVSGPEQIPRCDQHD